ncbi:hypothetical protein K438DRAFT_1768927 [Mycena galopus ATCC 62051]|nr:hypothetical protein K438DRAFT_1768927 [Mycena galopus ATCC 62051]
MGFGWLLRFMPGTCACLYLSFSLPFFICGALPGEPRPSMPWMPSLTLFLPGSPTWITATGFIGLYDDGGSTGCWTSLGIVKLSGRKVCPLYGGMPNKGVVIDIHDAAVHPLEEAQATASLIYGGSLPMVEPGFQTEEEFLATLTDSQVEEEHLGLKWQWQGWHLFSTLDELKAEA